jgi:hypothetical protein
LWQGIRLAKVKGLHKLIILGDSMLVIETLINQANFGYKPFPRVISWALSLLTGFDDYSFYHIKHELNNKADHWEKYGSILGEGELDLNGERGFLRIP